MKKVFDDHGVKMLGRLRYVLTGPDGIIKDCRIGNNVIVTNGKDFLASFLKSAVGAAATFTGRYVAIGTDSTAETSADAALGVEAARHTGTVSYISGGVFRVIATFATGSGTGAIVEFGLFSSSSAGTLIGRHTTAAVNKGANDTLTVTYDVTFS